MWLGTVTGRVWADRALPQLAGRRLVLVADALSTRHEVAVDLVDAGVGSQVLVTTDESAASACGESTVDLAVVALVAGHDPLRAGHSPSDQQQPSATATVIEGAR